MQVSYLYIMKNMHILVYTAATLFAIGSVLAYINGGFVPGSAALLVAVALYLVGAAQKAKQKPDNDNPKQ